MVHRGNAVFHHLTRTGSARIRMMADFIRQRVTDLTRFQTIFDRLKPNREAAGLTDLGQFCAADEADAVIVVMEVEDISRAEEYWHSDVLEGRTEAGIVAYRWVGQGSSDKAKASTETGA